MDFRQRVHLSHGKKNNLTNRSKKNLIKNISIVEDFFNNNKISNNDAIRLREIISNTNKKNLPESNIQKTIQKQNLFHSNQDEKRIRCKSANQSKIYNFVKNYSNINLKPKNLFKNKEIKFGNLLKEKKELSNDNLMSKIRPFSSYHSNMKKENNKSIKPKYLFNNNIQIIFNIFQLKINTSQILVGKRIIDRIKENRKKLKKFLIQIRKYK